MSDSPIDALLGLHRIDAELYSLKKRAEALDGGKSIAQEIEGLKAELEEAHQKAKTLSSELTDKEVQQQSFKEKIDSLNKRMFDGSINTPREIENTEKEIENLKELSSKNDDRLLELYELAPPAVEAEKEVKEKLEAKEAELQNLKENSAAMLAEIKSNFAQLIKERPEAAKGIDAGSMSLYEAARKKTGGIGMAEVDDDGYCSVCGVTVPERSKALIREDKVSTCEECKCVLFVMVPEVEEEE